ncbi:hypothetical protein O181_020662 [Austropuccinia psidii MF-1]|uniref:Uncharacterized protein n=1 Tax=Austropuccinia psidii MF-1 TaxID=1389203 RepID=A0A9Q3CDX7_9BASI|nr:hypothetical protein [Austropuccinia psidii MF-1]
MLADKHTRNANSLSNPSNYAARGFPHQDALARTPLWLMMMKAFPSGNGCQDPKQADGNNSRQLAQSLQKSDDPADEGWLWQEVIQVWADRHPCDLNAKSPRQPNPFPSGTQWLEDLFCAKQPEFHLISTFGSSELTVPPSVEPSQTDEPPIPGPSPSSKPHEDILTHEPEPEVAPTQSMEEPFAHPTPPHSVITIDDMPVGSPHSQNDARQEFTNLRPTLMIP